jgi:hypothetical protein
MIDPPMIDLPIRTALAARKANDGSGDAAFAAQSEIDRPEGE